METIIDNDRLNLEINPARERHAVFRKIDRFLRRIELNHNCIYDLVFDRSSLAQVPCDRRSRQPLVHPL